MHRARIDQGCWVSWDSESDCSGAVLDPSDPMEPSESGLERSLLAHQVFLQRLARALVGADADDLVQDVWQRVLERPPRHASRLRGWMARVASNLAANRRRGDLRRLEREAETARPHSIEHSPSDLEERFELQQAVLRFLDALGEPYRGSLLMRYFEGHSPEEIARRLGVPLPTVKTRLRRGLEQLRSALDQKYPGGRAEWLPALACFVGRPTVGATLTGGGAAAFGGTVAMKLWVGAVAVAAAVVGVILVVRDVGNNPPAAVAELSAALDETSGSPLEASSSEASRIEVSVSAVSEDPAPRIQGPSTINAVPSRRMRARVVDEGGDALAGATMSFSTEQARLEAKSGPDGLVALAVPLDQLPDKTLIQLDFTAKDRTLVTRQLDLRTAGDGHAGDVALLPAGSIVGRVVGPSGWPLAIPIGVVEPLPELAQQDREQLEVLGEGFAWRCALGESNEEGAYRIDSVPVGLCSIAARQPGAFYVWTEPIEVRAGQIADAGVLVFRAPSPDQCIEGVVLDSAGNPSRSKTVQLWKPGVARNVEPQAQSVSTDEAGRFRFAVQRGGVYHVVLVDESKRDELARVENAAAGGPTVVLRTPLQRFMDLFIISEGGVPIEGSRISMTGADGFGIVVRSEQVGAGAWRIELPGRPFYLFASAAGYAYRQTEVLDPTTAPERIELTLDRSRVARIHCFVIRSGEPVTDAKIDAYPRLEGFHSLTNGFLTRLEAEAVARASPTENVGLYELVVKNEGSVVLLVRQEGRVTLEHGPIHVRPDDAVRQLELDLPEPGSIEGQVLLAEGRHPAGILIGASRGDGDLRTFTLGDEPEYRFEGLAPGSWQVRRIDQPGNPPFLGDRRPGREQQQPTWDVILEPGQRARFDIDLKHEALCRVRGLVRLAPDGPAPWRYLLRGGLAQPVNSDGTFHADTLEPGETYLSLWASYGPSRQLMLYEKLDLTAGETSWVLDLASAELELTEVPAFKEDERSNWPELLRLNWTGSGARQGTLKISSHGGGPLTLRGLPPGDWEIESRYADDGSPERDWSRHAVKIVLGPGDRQAVEAKSGPQHEKVRQPRHF